MRHTLCRYATMVKKPRMSSQTLQVLDALLFSLRDEMSGVEIAEQTKLASGTLYPILLRLEESGWLQSRWEIDDPVALGRPRKRFYRVTAEGAKNARDAIKNLQPMLRRLAWNI